MINREVASKALEMMEVDGKGLDKMDHKLMLTMIEKYSGGPVGIESLAASISEEKDTIEDVLEPYLIQTGFIQRTPRGRIACLLYTSPSPRDGLLSRMPSSA